MEAEDSVMGEEALLKIVEQTMMAKYPAQLKAVAEVQAEISFKIGMQKVVEWVKSHEYTFGSLEWGERTSYPITDDELDAFLKENGL